MKLGFIGCGNMASAILKGVKEAKPEDVDSIILYDVVSEKAKEIACSVGAEVADSASNVAAECDAVVLAVKPNVLEGLLKEINPALEKKKPLLISIAAGKTLDFLEGCLTEDLAVVRVMPNINASVLAAVSAFCGNKNVSAEQLSFAERLCTCFGRAVKIDETMFPVFGVIGGCSPAFAYMFIDSMARAAVKNGMPKKMALDICAQAVLGSAKLVLESGENPWVLTDRVCSPGGTTIEGVLSLQKDGFESAVANAVQAAVDKDKKL